MAIQMCEVHENGGAWVFVAKTEEAHTHLLVSSTYSSNNVLFMQSEWMCTRRCMHIWIACLCTCYVVVWMPFRIRKGWPGEHSLQTECEIAFPSDCYALPNEQFWTLSMRVVPI